MFPILATSGEQRTTTCMHQRSDTQRASDRHQTEKYYLWLVFSDFGIGKRNWTILKIQGPFRDGPRTVALSTTGISHNEIDPGMHVSLQPSIAAYTGWAKKKDPLRFFANISAKSKNFKIKFYRLKSNSFLQINAKFHQKLPNTTKFTSLFMSLPHWFWPLKNMLHNIS